MHRVILGFTTISAFALGTRWNKIVEWYDCTTTVIDKTHFPSLSENRRTKNVCLAYLTTESRHYPMIPPHFDKDNLVFSLLEKKYTETKNAKRLPPILIGYEVSHQLITAIANLTNSKLVIYEGVMAGKKRYHVNLINLNMPDEIIREKVARKDMKIIDPNDKDFHILGNTNTIILNRELYGKYFPLEMFEIAFECDKVIFPNTYFK
jgi:hypothetical protein